MVVHILTQGVAVKTMDIQSQKTKVLARVRCYRCADWLEHPRQVGRHIIQPLVWQQWRGWWNSYRRQLPRRPSNCRVGCPQSAKSAHSSSPLLVLEDGAKAGTFREGGEDLGLFVEEK